jgi:hypothetical protein
MTTIWEVDSAYSKGDPFLLAAVASKVVCSPGFAGLAGLIQADARARAKANLAERASG